MSINRKEKRQEYTRGAEVMRHELGLYFTALFFSAGMATIAAIGTGIFVLSAILAPNEGEIFFDRLVAAYNVSAGHSSDKVKVELGMGDKAKTYEMPSDKLLEITTPEWTSIKKKLWITLLFSILCGVAL